MLQPAIASKLFADETLAGIGTLARTLLVAPAGTAGSRMFRDPPPSASLALAEYDAVLLEWMRRPPRAMNDDPTVLDPEPMALDNEARQQWIAFHDAVEVAQKPDGELHSIRSFASKMAEHAGRLAAVLAAYSDPRAAIVPPTAMAGGIELAKHYAAELIRLQGAANIPSDLRLAGKAARMVAGSTGTMLSPSRHLPAKPERNSRRHDRPANSQHPPRTWMDRSSCARLRPRREGAGGGLEASPVSVFAFDPWAVLKLPIAPGAPPNTSIPPNPPQAARMRLGGLDGLDGAGSPKPEPRELLEPAEKVGEQTARARGLERDAQPAFWRDLPWGPDRGRALSEAQREPGGCRCCAGRLWWQEVCLPTGLRCAVCHPPDHLPADKCQLLLKRHGCPSGLTLPPDMPPF